MKSRANIDGGWALVVLGAVVFNLTVVGTVTVCLGMFQDQFLQHYDGSTAFISLVCSLFISLQSILGPVASVICNTFSIRTSVMVGGSILSVGLVASSITDTLPQLLACFGILSGTGFGIVYTPTAVAVGHYFKEKRVFANGIALASAGIGILSGPHLIGWLIDQFGWRIAMSTLGCITAQMVVMGSLIFPLETTSRTNENRMFCCLRKKYSTAQAAEAEDLYFEPAESSERSSCQCCRKRCDESVFGDNSKQDSACSVLKNKLLWVFSLNYFMEMMGYSIQIVHLPSYARSVGVPQTKVPSLFTAYGLTLTVARFLGGAACNDKSIDLLMVYLSCQGLKAITVILMPLFAHGFAELLLYQVLYGIFFGFSYILLTPIIVELFGVAKLATVFGLTLCVGGMSYLIGPTVAGALFDMTSSYSAGFHIGGSVSFLGSMLLFLIPILRRNAKVHGQSENKEHLVVTENKAPLLVSENKDQLLLHENKKPLEKKEIESPC
ncbi:monocarboxylate transporter 12-like isoform X1 [Haliotis rufescens]|uniref:monocarboxylate transporter 12-like isoform X1 n=2 Tax=Haliotis rufescens TaxID=6454 RepID=UPI00201E8EB7|nr:monocarboxylate transporter 12-like isoform X1 [Haliotis rufescens]XP_048245343.1 monocarboxylate transporter 12-like isoform X1 [Haliotis rufescens]